MHGAALPNLKQKGVACAMPRSLLPLRVVPMKASDPVSNPFQANCLPLLVGSLPLGDHREAVELVFAHTPAIPGWAQLPNRPAEGMIRQFLPGLPGLTTLGDRLFVDTAAADFDEQLLAFYEDYMAVADDRTALDHSRFTLSDDTAAGFSALQQCLRAADTAPAAVKGQVTGPFTFGTGVQDQHRQAIFYNDQLRDAAVKLLALKAVWQIRHLSGFGRPVIIFCDEPALAGFGTSEFISISRDDVTAVLSEVIEAIHSEGALAGVHVCANTDWSLVLASGADIVNFDAYFYFDRFVLYTDAIRAFIEAGGIMAWGIVPTGDVDVIERETADSLLEKLETHIRSLERLGMDREKILTQSLITPSCGMGSLPPAAARKVLRLTVAVAEGMRAGMKAGHG
jgi:methionine synthase II (cobalamin-independent)